MSVFKLMAKINLPKGKKKRDRSWEIAEIKDCPMKYSEPFFHYGLLWTLSIHIFFFSLIISPQWNFNTADTFRRYICSLYIKWVLFIFLFFYFLHVLQEPVPLPALGGILPQLRTQSGELFMAFRMLPPGRWNICLCIFLIDEKALIQSGTLICS